MEKGQIAAFKLLTVQLQGVFEHHVVTLLSGGKRRCVLRCRQTGQCGRAHSTAHKLARVRAHRPKKTGRDLSPHSLGRRRSSLIRLTPFLCFFFLSSSSSRRCLSATDYIDTLYTHPRVTDNGESGGVGGKMPSFPLSCPDTSPQGNFDPRRF